MPTQEFIEKVKTEQEVRKIIPDSRSSSFSRTNTPERKSFVEELEEVFQPISNSY